MLLFLLASAAGEGSVAAASPGLVLHESPKELPGVRFYDGKGHPLSLAYFHGRVVLLNNWATWCVPCRMAMPTLDRMQAALGGASFEVVALSIDRGGLDVVGKFYGEIGISHLATYVDNTGKAAREVADVSLPTTLLIDHAGREIARLVGPAEWDAPDMTAFIRQQAKLHHLRSNIHDPTEPCSNDRNATDPRSFRYRAPLSSRVAWMSRHGCDRRGRRSRLQLELDGDRRHRPVASFGAALCGDVCPRALHARYGRALVFGG